MSSPRSPEHSPTMFADRIARVRSSMDSHGIDALLLSVGSDLPYFCGYEAMPLSRITMLVVPRDGEAVLVIPALEVARVVERPDVFRILAWGETTDPISVIADLVGPAEVAAVGDHMWAGFLIDLTRAMPATTFRRASEVTSPIRSVKDTAEIRRLRAAAAAVDRIAGRLQGGEIELVGRTEAAVSAELGRQILDEGHSRVNFAIVAAGPNSASPHHHPGERIIGPDEVVLCDFGGSMVDDDGIGYCSDITRCVWTGPDPADELLETYAVLHEAQAASVRAATVGTPAQEVDRVGRRRITAAGFGSYFIHRTGHGIGVEEHENPYIVEGNEVPLEAGNAFSIEPGIYMEGKWGIRLEDIVVAAEDGPDLLNTADRRLAALG